MANISFSKNPPRTQSFPVIGSSEHWFFFFLSWGQNVPKYVIVNVKLGDRIGY